MTIFEILAVGTLAFWVLVAVELVILFLSVSKDSAIAASISLLIFGLVIQFVSKVDIIGYVSTNPIAIVSIVLLYLAVGTLWGIFKWRDFLIKYKEEYDDIKAKWLKAYSYDMDRWESYLSSNHSRKYPERGHKYDKPPQINENKSRWINWAALWPISVICYLIGDLIFNIFNSLYRQVANYLQSMSDKIYAPIYVDLKKKDEKVS